MIKKTTITFGKVALEAERAKLARSGTIGGQVMAFEHMVERLAGGFLRIVDIMTLRETVKACLDDEETNLGELDVIKSMPGMTTACADSLMAWWMSGLCNSDFEHQPRMQAIFSLEEAVEQRLPPHLRKPADIVEMACKKIAFAPKVLGEVVFHGMTDLHPVWRPVLEAMAGIDGYGFTWDGGPYSVPEWISSFPVGTVKLIERAPEKPSLAAETASDARHEVLEALRWAVELLAAGHKGEDIAIAAVSTGAYEGIVHTIARDSDIEIYMPNGIPTLQTPTGQECAALADILIRGISHKRVRRLYEVASKSKAFEGIPEDWVKRIPQDSSLLTADRWKRLLTRNDMADVKPYLEAVIDGVSKGVPFAEEAGPLFLSEEAQRLWTRALRSGPASALDQTLRGMRVSIKGTALDKVCFMSARDLVAAPRRFVRLLGLTSRQWPRRDGEDSLIPNYIVPTRQLSPMSVSEIDRRDFHSILSTTAERVVFSWPRMDGDGRELRPSTLVASSLVSSATRLDRARKTRYAISEGDRLFMRTSEFADTKAARRAKAASVNWFRPSLTAHDGLITPNHPRIEAVFGQVQSATSLQKMIRDPLGFVWRYALGFNAPEFDDEPILVDARVFGNVVHAILKLAVEKLNRKGGFTRAARAVVKMEVHKARLEVGQRMEQSQPVPPTLVWSQTLDRAEDIAARTLVFDYGMPDDTVSFAEIPFGDQREWIPEDLPWAVDKPVFIPGTNIRIRGSLDRLDLSASTSLANVLDYKTGKTPKNPEQMGINGGLELQRAIYGFTVETLLDGCEQIVAALYYPLTDTYVPMDDIKSHMAEVSAAVVTAQETLRAGHAFPGIGAAEEYNDMMFGFPARATSVYLAEKMQLIGPEHEGLRKVWETP
jgi:hypothetical protein